MRFLVVDDSATMRRIVVNTLQRIGYSDVREAEDGTDALEKFGADIGFVIADWNMPNLSGAGLARAIREQGSKVPILLVCARSMRDDMMGAVSTDCNGYIVKPFTPDILRERIAALTPTPTTEENGQ